jgi:putative phosphoesterase
MKAAFISDIHSNLEALQSVFQYIRDQDIDTVYCLGDLVGYGPNPNEVLDMIREAGIPTLQGNYDEGVGFDRMACGCDYKDEKAMAVGSASLYWTQEQVTDENKEFLKDLPQQLIVKMGKWKLHLVHGSPRLNNEYLFVDAPQLAQVLKLVDGDILLCGHTHLPYIEKKDDMYIINTGSVGKPKHGTPDASLVVIDFSGDEIHAEILYIPYDFARTADKIRQSELPDDLAESLERGTG